MYSFDTLDTLYEKIILFSNDFPSNMRENSQVEVDIEIDGLISGGSIDAVQGKKSTSPGANLKITIPSIIIKDGFRLRAIKPGIFSITFSLIDYIPNLDEIYKIEPGRAEVKTDLLLSRIKEKLITDLYSFIELTMSQTSDKNVAIFEDPWLVELTKIRKEKLRKVNKL